MTRPLAIITDVHGCFATFRALLDKVRAKVGGSFDLYLLGDLVDRGPRSREVVEWAMRKGVPTCQGNHDSFLADHVLKTGLYAPGLWASHHPETIASFGGYIPQSVAAWAAKLPYYIIPPEYPELLLSHTGHGMSVLDVKKAYSSRFKDPVLDPIWRRDTHFPDDGRFRVFGHTPNSNPIITDTYANIDTACVFGGTLTAFLWPSREIVQQTNIDR